MINELDINAMLLCLLETQKSANAMETNEFKKREDNDNNNEGWGLA